MAKEKNTMNDFNVLFEDFYLIAVEKSENIEVDSGNDTQDLKKSVTKYLGNKCKIKNGAGVIHRLDKPVSGIVLLAKTPQALKKMNEAFENRKVRKYYTAQVEGLLENKKGHLENFIYKDLKLKKAIIAKSQSQYNKPCQLKYEVLKVEPPYSYLEIELLTGRYHQIRAQLAHIGHPICGDHKYGATIEQSRIMLHASKLVFSHPVSGEKIIIESKPKFFN